VIGRPFNVAVTEQADGAVVQVGGEIDILTAPVLHRHLESVIAAARRTVVIDLSETTFLDARGVGVLIAARKQIVRYGGRLVVRRPPPLVRRVLELADQIDRLEVQG
jgi:stage II sporulation protein AA (anti-sigma F factor antagonist)